MIQQTGLLLAKFPTLQMSTICGLANASTNDSSLRLVVPSKHDDDRLVFVPGLKSFDSTLPASI